MNWGLAGLQQLHPWLSLLPSKAIILFFCRLLWVCPRRLLCVWDLFWGKGLAQV